MFTINVQIFHGFFKILLKEAYFFLYTRFILLLQWYITGRNINFVLKIKMCKWWSLIFDNFNNQLRKIKYSIGRSTFCTKQHIIWTNLFIDGTNFHLFYMTKWPLFSDMVWIALLYCQRKRIFHVSGLNVCS